MHRWALHGIVHSYDSMKNAIIQSTCSALNVINDHSFLKALGLLHNTVKLTTGLLSFISWLTG